ncbi:Uu.00g123750.m01.CDS01 [Anthostomella pinea]|uniref:Uu.00g123750.m01.CDS01 n=1 Tax=Anthostomella pinea TaxID=933095 RepID=A0AAI8YHJ5_9PEZI|nr:Uu.00g123750.m01.CDS01 [Anthostomella pinea]
MQILRSTALLMALAIPGVLSSTIGLRSHESVMDSNVFDGLSDSDFKSANKHALGGGKSKAYIDVVEGRKFTLSSGGEVAAWLKLTHEEKKHYQSAGKKALSTENTNPSKLFRRAKTDNECNAEACGNGTAGGDDAQCRRIDCQGCTPLRVKIGEAVYTSYICSA